LLIGVGKDATIVARKIAERGARCEHRPGVAVMAPVPRAHNMWRAWLGANLTHGLGLLVFALLLAAIAMHDYALVPAIPGIRPLSIGVSLTYAVIALRFWFSPLASLRDGILPLMQGSVSP